MDPGELRWLRATGIAGIAAAAAWTVGDALLVGNSATQGLFDQLNAKALAEVVQNDPADLPSTAQLAAGALVAVFTAPLYLAGVAHLFLASRALAAAFLLVVAYSIAPFVHGSFFYVAEILRTVQGAGLRDGAPVLELATRTAYWVVVAYAALLVPALLGFGWLTVAIARGRTLYPRWVAVANPLVCMLVASFVDRILPAPLDVWLSGAGLNLGMLAFFALSTRLLWNPAR